MKPILGTALALAVLAISGTQIGRHRADLTEYEAVSADGPYSYLPIPEWIASPDVMAQADAADTITPEEALKIDALLTMLAGRPTNPARADAPLDGPVLSDTAIVLAGL